MAEFTNITLEKNKKTIAELYCSTEFTAEVHNEVTFLSAINIFLSMTTFVENSLVLVALRKTRSLHPPSKVLYLNLALTDLSVGIIVEPLYVSYLMSVLNKRWDICYYALLSSIITSYVMCSVSLLTLITTSMDRLLALLLGLSIADAVTPQRGIPLSGYLAREFSKTLYFRQRLLLNDDMSGHSQVDIFPLFLRNVCVCASVDLDDITQRRRSSYAFKMFVSLTILR
ncbi:unnamed protein product [Porites lobata]|uniref:G-protein coupled receptors family 1 profile domain-containing protein n=1 Tax=Porites lobata TaxID=104759 RepID=A0ABN8QV85_9CNID|nr:unnamed protein product [Porites lobata]